VFLALAISTFMTRNAPSAKAVYPHIAPGSTPARKLQTALGKTSGVCLRAPAGRSFFPDPRFNAGYLSGFNLQPSLISFTDDVELGQIARSRKAAP